MFNAVEDGFSWQEITFLKKAFLLHSTKAASVTDKQVKVFIKVYCILYWGHENSSSEVFPIRKFKSYWNVSVIKPLWTWRGRSISSAFLLMEPAGHMWRLYRASSNNDYPKTKSAACSELRSPTGNLGWNELKWWVICPESKRTLLSRTSSFTDLLIRFQTTEIQCNSQGTGPHV